MSLLNVTAVSQELTIFNCDEVKCVAINLFIIRLSQTLVWYLYFVARINDVGTRVTLHLHIVAVQQNCVVVCTMFYASRPSQRSCTLNGSSEDTRGADWLALLSITSIADRRPPCRPQPTAQVLASRRVAADAQ